MEEVPSGQHAEASEAAAVGSEAVVGGSKVSPPSREKKSEKKKSFSMVAPRTMLLGGGLGGKGGRGQAVLLWLSSEWEGV